MRMLPMLLLAGALLGACNDPSGPSSGSLLVSTSMTGTEPDEDGYELLVDGEPVLDLDGSDTKELALDSGAHTLDLQGLDPHCVVEPAVPFEVRVGRGDPVSVNLAVNCPPTGAIVTVRYTGLDTPTFYRVAVDGVAGNSVVTSAPTMLTRLRPGDHTVELLGASENCTLEGPSSVTVTVISGAFVPLDFDARCTAKTGVIRVLLTADGEDVGLDYRVEIDGVPRSFALPTPFHVTGVAGGEHAVGLRLPLNCSVEGGVRSVTVQVGGPVRDTVDVAFAVTCVRLRATLRVVTTTSGTPSTAGGYDVYLWEGDYYYYYQTFLGRVQRSGALEVEVTPGTYRLMLYQPPGCAIAPAPGQFTIEHGQLLELPFEVTCAP